MNKARTNSKRKINFVYSDNDSLSVIFQENELLQQIVLIGIKNKVDKIVGFYNKSKQNEQCKDFYLNNNFIRDKKEYFLMTKKFKPKDKFIKSKLVLK